MKNIAVVFAMMMLFSCSSRTENASSMDSMNAVSGHPVEDSLVAPPDHTYTSSDENMDTVQSRKDSANKQIQ